MASPWYKVVPRWRFGFVCRRRGGEALWGLPRIFSFDEVVESVELPIGDGADGKPVELEHAHRQNVESHLPLLSEARSLEHEPDLSPGAEGAFQMVGVLASR